MRHTQLINHALYQMGWFACVLGGASHRPWTGFLIAMILVGVHLTLSVERSLEVRLAVLAATVGAAGGPLAFLAGERLGAITLLPPLAYNLLRLSVSWAIALLVFSAVVRRVAPERGADYRRMRQEWA